MQRTVLLVVTWMFGTAVALGLSALAVRTVGQRLTDPPRRIADAAVSPTAAPGTSVATSTSVAPTASSTSAVAVATPPPSGPVTSAGGATTPVTTPTIGPGTYRTRGGVVVVTCAGDIAGLAAASPALGWTVDVRDTGPERVEVRFELAGADPEAPDGADEANEADDADGEALETATQARVRASCSGGVVDAEVR